MSIHIVTHAYAGDLPQYAVFLRAQLSSLILYKPKTPVSITVCVTADDEKVVKVLADLSIHFGNSLDICWLPKEQLFRRSIGRNIVALQTHQHLLWATDVDHVFGDGCLDELQDTWNWFPPDKKPVMVWPNQIQIQMVHELGDRYVEKHLESTGLIDINPKEFELKTYNRSIGGIQIINGQFCRKHGYLNGSKRWQRPVSPVRPFPSFADDVRFRAFCASQGEVEAISVKNLYRLRHSKTTYQ